jgi:hypothetical protein
MKLKTASVSDSCACCSERHAFTVADDGAGTSASNTCHTNKASDAAAASA